MPGDKESDIDGEEHKRTGGRRGERQVKEKRGSRGGEEEDKIEDGKEERKGRGERKERRGEGGIRALLNLPPGVRWALTA